MLAHTVFSVFNWLVANNLWRDVIQLSVASIFGFFLAISAVIGVIVESRHHGSV